MFKLANENDKKWTVELVMIDGCPTVRIRRGNVSYDLCWLDGINGCLLLGDGLPLSLRDEGFTLAEDCSGRTGRLEVMYEEGVGYEVF
jgi:hypothetical protein